MILLMSTFACRNGVMLRFVFPNLRSSVITLLIDVMPQVYLLSSVSSFFSFSNQFLDILDAIFA